MKRLAAILSLLLLAPAGARAQGAVPAADDTQRLGMRLFNQSCRVCHTAPHAGSAQYGPVLSRDSLGGEESALRAFVANGSPRMPGFKSHFRPEEIAAVVAYLKSLPAAPVRGPEPD
jgi:mono/diheme cytochrome c family protein